MAGEQDPRSLGELFTDLARETGLLVRQEIRQAGVEMSQRVSGVSRDGALLAGGAVIVHAAFLALVAAIILVLGEIGLPWWLAAAIVAVVLGAIGAFIIRSASAAIKQADIVPRHTIDQLREDQEWIKEQAT